MQQIIKEFMKIYPITRQFAFIKGDINIIFKTFVDWQNLICSKNNNSVEFQVLHDDFYKTLYRLSPLTTGERRRYLFIKCGDWIAFIDNGHLGTDRGTATYLGETCKSDVIYFYSNNYTGENLFEYYDIINGNSNLKRAIAVTNENNWKFFQFGKPFDFELKDVNKIKPIKDRFTQTHLVQYLEHLGIKLFNYSFSDTQSGSIFINKIGPLFNSTKELSLDQLSEFFN